MVPLANRSGRAKTQIAMKFLDQAKVYVRSGDGGAGALVSGARSSSSSADPSGGDGGRGGDVWAEAVDGLNTLIDYRYQQHFKAGTGGHGMGKSRAGANAQDIVLKVPAGTQIYEEDNETLIADLVQAGRAGPAGPGRQRRLRQRALQVVDQPGAAPGQSRRSPARSAGCGCGSSSSPMPDIVGLPNAGKSTFLAAVSAARPKIAALSVHDPEPASRRSRSGLAAASCLPIFRA